MADTPAVAIAGLQGFYGDSQVLHGIDLAVAPGETVAILGRNGAGKTTTLRAIMGILEKRRGSIRLFGRETVGLPPERVARMGVGYVPEERGIFSTLNVTENLMLPPVLKDGGLTLDEIYKLFPNLLERRRSQGTRLSGGEQQMLAIARVLRTGASVLLLDEPTEGLAPVIVEQIEQVIARMKQRGLTIMLVEQNFRVAARLADRHYVIESGRVVDMIDRAAVASSTDKIQAYLGI
jgi:branched-chain amino acid transport system ATP-binding protein